MFGSEGATPLKAHDWKAYLPSTLDTASFWGPIFGIIREETESIYIFDSKKYEDSKYVIGYIDNGSFQAKTAYKAFNFPVKRVIGVWENGELTLKLTSDPIATAIMALRHQLTEGGEAVVNQDGVVTFNPADPSVQISNDEGFTPVDRSVLAAPTEKVAYSDYYGNPLLMFVSKI